MSREQLTEQTQGNATADYAAREGDVDGLPPHLYGLVMRLRPGDAPALVTLLRQNLPYSERILAAASPHVGLSTIKQAQAMMPANTVGAGGSLGTFRPGGEYDLDDTPVRARYTGTEEQHNEELIDLDDDNSLVLPDDLRRQVATIPNGDGKALGNLLAQHPEHFDNIVMHARSSHGVDMVSTAIDVYNNLRDNPAAATDNDQGETDASDTGKVTAKRDEAWATGARAYNAKHTQWVSKFIDIMKDPIRARLPRFRARRASTRMDAWVPGPWPRRRSTWTLTRTTSASSELSATPSGRPRGGRSGGERRRRRCP
jgi:hypothetical protein